MRTTLAFVAACVLLGSVPALVGAEEKGLPAYHGPRKRIAVLPFETKAPGAERSVGAGLSDMTVTALVNTGRFVVVEREELDKVIAEQDLGNSGYLRPGTEPRLGQLLGAQLLLKGAVTEFQREQSGGGIGGALGKVAGGLGTSKAKVAIDLRLIDTTTGEVLVARTADGTTSGTGLNLGTVVSGVRVRGDLFKSKEIEAAARKAIEEIVRTVIDEAREIPWSGKVVIVKDGKVYINAGSNMNMTAGMRLEVFRPGEELIDPDTGLSLGATESRIGAIEIADVQEKFSICTPREGEGFAKGDVVRLAEAKGTGNE